MCSRWIPAFVALALTVCCAQAQFPVTISPTATVAASASTDTGQDQGVHLATDRRGRWMAVWSSTDDAGLGLGPDADILFSMSDDDGMTWDVPQALPGMNADVLEDLAPRVTTNRRGTWMITWYANSATDADVYVAVTDDNGQSFSTPRLIDPVMAVDSGDDFLPRLETDTQGVWMVAWQTCDPTGGGLGTDEDIVYARSLDDGETWSAPVAWYAYAATDGSADVNVALATDAQGNWIAAWQSDRNLGGIGVDDDILYVRSADSGMTWSTPLPVASNATTDTGRDLSPALTTDGQCNWVIAWHSTENLGGINTDYDIFRVTSNDNGMTWSAPAVLNGTASGDAAPDFGVNLATDHRGNWVASWTSLDAGGGLGSDSDVLVAHSADAGVTWSMPVPLNDDALTDTGGDEGAVIVADRDGGWIGAWYAYLGMNGSLGSDRDVLTASFFIDLSALDPGPLTPPGAISNMATTDVGGDFRVSLASDGEVSWYATWSSTVELSGAIGSDEDIFFARSGDNGTTWTNVIAVSDLALQDSGRDINPVIAFDGECVLVVAWASQSVPGTGAITDYDIFFTRSEDHGLTWSPSARVKTTGASDAGDDGFFDVSLATDGQGTWVCAWDSTDPLSGSGTDYDIMYAVSTDNGVTWGTPRLLNSTAASDTLPDTFCRLATDGNGRWIATWDSFEPIAGSGTDRDIMYAVSTDGGQNWGMASPLGTNAAGDVGEDALPSIAAGRGGRWMAVWQSNDDLGGLGPDFDIVASTSSNGGMTWSAPVPVNTHAPGDPGFDSEPWVATDGTGRWVVAWWSTADVGGMLGPDADVLWSTSRDLGASWSDAAVLNSDADTDVSFERSVRVATNARGTWLAGWESSGDSASPFGADFDVLQARFALAPLCPGDTNGDQTVDFDDLNRVLELWAVTDADPEWDPSVDLVPSGRIDFADLNAVLTAFGTYCD